MTAVTELEARPRTVWASGDQTLLLPLGPRLVDACGIGPSDRVLDVASGTRSASISAARRGAHVTASDLTPELLPFESESFDVVMSSLGVMFAPDHQAVADELVRVCRPRGRIGLLSWTPEGMLGALFRAMKPFASQSPTPWGSEEHLADLFGGRVAFRTLRRGQLVITAFERAADYGEHLRTAYGPAIAARADAAREGRVGPFDGALDAFCDAWNRGTGDHARFDQEYLIAVGTRAAA